MLNSLLITGFYAALLTLVYLVLAIRIIRLRWKHRVGIGTGEAADLMAAVRIHGNFIEYVPLALILLGAIEVSGAATSLIHGIGIALLVARLCHAIGLTRSVGVSLPRTIGVIGTFAVLLLEAGILIGRYIGVAVSLNS